MVLSHWTHLIKSASSSPHDLRVDVFIILQHVFDEIWNQKNLISGLQNIWVTFSLFLIFPHPVRQAISNWISTNTTRALPYKHMALTPARTYVQLYLLDEWGSSSGLSPGWTAPPQLSAGHTHPSMKTHRQLCLLTAVYATFSSTCAGVSLSKPLWTCEVLGWVNRKSSSTSWTGMEPDCLYMKIKQGKTYPLSLFLIRISLKSMLRWFELVSWLLVCGGKLEKPHIQSQKKIQSQNESPNLLETLK